ncbi:class II histone deacetylase [Corynebacterium frankenforstense]|uniref:class II histone deacetylase n=1 Tax=Corynebacterium TaxID=1716 RepID=UPI00254C2FD8|nr:MULTISPECIES: class II histone deacetylase [Corynebacterium]MDK6259615.1 class II histone deacetylase [Corynebacterium frankenforstense]MDK8894813.1 class II histone deacetylase [Corynebacterium sp. MSK006]
MTTDNLDKPRVGFLWETLYGWHDTGSGGDEPSDPARGLQPVNRHFSAPGPKRRLNEIIQVSDLRQHLTHLQATPATEEQILRAHTKRHYDYIVSQSELPKGGDCGDGGSPFGHNALQIAQLSAGGAITAVNSVLDGEVDRAYALINPPGHHAERDRSLGFCLFNNSSVAVADALERPEVSKVAIIDWDVHHGNGTQDIWWEDPRVLTVSIHQDRNFPVDSGFIEERGAGEGLGANFNIPLPPGAGNEVYLAAIKESVIPALEEFQPDLIVVATGYDAAMMDPLGRMMVTTEGYREMTDLMIGAAKRLCAGKLVFIQEGGYCQYYVPFCGLATMESLTERSAGFDDAYASIVDGQIRTEITAEQREHLDRAREAYFSEASTGLGEVAS